MTNNVTITGEVCAIQRPQKTLSFTPNLMIAGYAKFKELVVGKINVSLYDFSKGKADNGKRAYYNLDLADLKYLYEKAKCFHMTEEFKRSKIYGNATYNGDNPEFKGLNPVFKISIQRVPFKMDKDGKQVKLNAPWIIAINNGYAKAAPGKYEGAFYESPGTYKQESYVIINITDEEMYDRMETLYAYLNEFRRYAADKLLAPCLAKLDEVLVHNRHDANLTAPEKQQAENKPQERKPGKAQDSVAKKEQTNKTTAPETTQSQNSGQNHGQNNVQKHNVTMIVTSDFVPMENNIFVAKCMWNGKEWKVFFKTLPDKLKSAKETGASVDALLYIDNKRIWFDQLVA